MALKQYRYSWRHDSVLFTLEPVLQKHLTTWNESKKKAEPSKVLIPFVKPGEHKFVKSSKQKQETKSRLPDHLLHRAHDWQCQIDYRDDSKIFPPNICSTSLRPDIVIWSTQIRFVILIELTCPSEENINQAKARKEARYADLLQQIEHGGWAVKLFTVEASPKLYFYTLRI